MKRILLALAFAVAAVAAPKPATNKLCPVLGSPVDAKSPIVVVKDQQYRICCAMCEAELNGNPDKFLKPDGTPRNAK